MAKKIKIRRQDLKKDELAIWLHDTITYIKENPAKVQTYVGITIGVIVGIIIIYSAVSTSVKNVRSQFAQAQAVYQRCVPGEKEEYRRAKKLFTAIINKYVFTKEAKLSRFYKGACCYYLGEYDDAKVCFEEFIEKYPKHTLAPTAYIRIGNIYEQKKEFKKAISSYKALIEKYPDSFEISNAWISIGRCYQKIGDIKQAKAAYGKVKITSEWADKARFLRSSL
jgi:tetratricopeptide (TPR) repeat protein